MHIIEAIGEIENYTGSISKDDYINNSMMRFDCIKQIEIIGEAANHITSETKAIYPTIEWPQIIGMRHILIHEYFGIDNDLIWQIIMKDIPVLKAAIENVLTHFNDQKD